MSKDMNVRWGWLKIMYWYTIFGAGGFGLAIVLFPETVRSLFRWPAQDPIVYGVTGSVWMAFGVLSIFGLRSPLKFVPILLMQLCYKSAKLFGLGSTGAALSTMSSALLGWLVAKYYSRKLFRVRSSRKIYWNG